MPGLMDNKLLLYYLAGAGGAIGGEGSVAQALGGITQQQIQTENFQKLLKTLLAGGSKVAMDKEGLTIKAPAAAFRDTEYTIPGFDESYAGVSNATFPQRATATMGTPKVSELDTYNPSASPLDVSSADLAGLTPETISQALQLKFAGEELQRKKLADISEAGYYGAATRKMEAETAALTPSIDIGGGIKLTGKQFVDVWKAATKDERTAAVKNYEYARSQGYEGSFENWMKQLAEASGKSLAEIMAEFVAKKEATNKLDLNKPGLVSDIVSDLKSISRFAWEDPPGISDLQKELNIDYDTAKSILQNEMVAKEIENRIREVYAGKHIERRYDGWYVDGKRVKRNPFYGGD